jgi:hypothetical protein
MRIVFHLTRGTIRRHIGAVAAGIVAFGLTAGAANVPAAQAAVRSTTVLLINSTGCDLNLAGYALAHGIWTMEPPQYIDPGTQVSWASESNGFMTGTEGYARFTTSDCANPALRRKVVRVHWANPFLGSSSYDSAETDPAFTVPYNGGTGNKTSVTFTAKAI